MVPVNSTTAGSWRAERNSVRALTCRLKSLTLGRVVLHGFQEGDVFG